MDPTAKPRAQAKTWDAARRRAGLVVPGLADITGPWRTLLAQWGIAEVAPGRLVPWLAVAFGFGIVGYFTADREAAWWAAWMAAVLAIAIAYAARLRPVGFPFALGVAGIVAGFAAATVQTVRIAHPVLQFTGISRHRRPIGGALQRPRHFRGQEMAGGRRRRPHGQGSEPA